MLRRSSLRSLASPSNSRATLPPCAPARCRVAPPGASLRLRRVGALRASPLLRLVPQRASVLKTDYYQLGKTLTCFGENTNVFLQRKAVFPLSFFPPFPCRLVGRRLRVLRLTLRRLLVVASWLRLSLLLWSCRPVGRRLRVLRLTLRRLPVVASSLQ